MSILRLLKRVLALGLILIICGGALLWISYAGERDYQANCKTLNMECEPGNAQKLIARLQIFYDKLAGRFAAAKEE